MIVGGLRALWLLLAVTPVMLVAERRFDPTTGLCVVLYAVGWLLLELARRRDSEGTQLLEFGRTLPGRIGLLFLLVVLQSMSFVLSSYDVFIALIACGTGIFALWAFSADGRRMADIAGRVLLVGAVLFLLVVLGELLLRLPPVVARTGGTENDRELWTIRNYDFSWERNIFGLRSFNVESPKRRDTLRIVTLGDSVTWGDKIPQTEDTWPFVLERLLTERGVDTDVVNLARNGYSTVNEAEALDRLGWRFDPDLVILQFYVNDPLPSGPDFKAQSMSWLFRTRGLSPIKHHALIRDSYLYAFLNGRFEQLQIAVLFPGGHLPLFEPDFEGWIAAQAALRQMAEQSRDRQVPMLVVMFPHLSDLQSASYKYASIHTAVARAVEAVDLPMLDLRPRFAEIDSNGDAWWALPWDAHPNARAHAIAGEAILEKLESSGALSKARARTEIVSPKSR